MALTTPILYSQVAFDATKTQAFSFGVIGGDQVIQNKLTITNQATNEVIYNQTQTSYSFVHTVPANTLTNGVYYSAYIITYNANGNASPQSNSIQFFCYSTPSFQFTNLPIGNIITNSSFTFEVTYSQAQGELLDTFSFTLYDASQSQISTSGIKYIGSSVAPPTSISYTFSGFSDQTNYYIRANGQTVQGTLVDTGLIAINVSYIKPNIFSIIELSNNCQGGYINIKSNLIEIRSSSNPSPPVYVNNNTAVDARVNGRYVEWDSGFNTESDFTASLWGRDFNENSDIITMIDDEGNNIVIRYRTNAEGTVYADATVTNGTIIYYIFSPSIATPASTQKIQFWFRRIGYQYEIKLEIVS